MLRENKVSVSRAGYFTSPWGRYVWQWNIVQLFLCRSVGHWNVLCFWSFSFFLPPFSSRTSQFCARHVWEKTLISGWWDSITLSLIHILTQHINYLSSGMYTCDGVCALMFSILSLTDQGEIWERMQGMFSLNSFSFDLFAPLNSAQHEWQSGRWQKSVLITDTFLVLVPTDLCPSLHCVPLVSRDTHAFQEDRGLSDLQ